MKTISDILEQNLQKNAASEVDGRKLAFIVLMCAFFFTCMSMEYGLGSFLPVFSVHSNLHSTEAQGAFAKSILYWSLAGGRLAALLVANIMAPQLMLIMSMIFCLAGGAGLWILGPYSIEGLEVMINIILKCLWHCLAEINSHSKPLFKGFHSSNRFCPGNHVPKWTPVERQPHSCLLQGGRPLPRSCTHASSYNRGPLDPHQIIHRDHSHMTPEKLKHF